MEYEDFKKFSNLGNELFMNNLKLFISLCYDTACNYGSIHDKDINIFNDIMNRFLVNEECGLDYLYYDKKLDVTLRFVCNRLKIFDIIETNVETIIEQPIYEIRGDFDIRLESEVELREDECKDLYDRIRRDQDIIEHDHNYRPTNDISIIDLINIITLQNQADLYLRILEFYNLSNPKKIALDNYRVVVDYSEYFSILLIVNTNIKTLASTFKYKENNTTSRIVILDTMVNFRLRKPTPFEYDYIIQIEKNLKQLKDLRVRDIRDDPQIGYFYCTVVNYTL